MTHIVSTTAPFFISMDSSFDQDINSLLITDVCNITAEYLSEEMRDICQKMDTKNLLSRGVLSGMNFLQRNTMETLLYLRNATEVNKA